MYVSSTTSPSVSLSNTSVPEPFPQLKSLLMFPVMYYWWHLCYNNPGGTTTSNSQLCQGSVSNKLFTRSVMRYLCFPPRYSLDVNIHRMNTKVCQWTASWLHALKWLSSKRHSKETLPLLSYNEYSSKQLFIVQTKKLFHHVVSINTADMTSVFFGPKKKNQ